MFRKTLRAASAAAADAAADSFSSLPSPPNGKLSSLLTRPPKPTPLNSRNSTSLVTIPPETTSSSPNNWLYGPKIRLSTARLEKFLQTNCKSGDVSADEAFEMEPEFPLHSFNLLLRGLAENERYYDVLSLYGKMNSVGLIPNFVTLNILLKCLCYANRVSDGFLVMGRIIRMGYRPTMETFNSLYEGLFIGNRVSDAGRLFSRLEKNFDCFPDEVTFSILSRAIYGEGYTINDVRFNKEKISIYDQYIDGLCDEWREDEAEELLSDVDVQGHQPLSVNEHVKGQEELKLNIHSKD